MNREQFFYLYLNTNSLLDIAMQEAYTDLMAEVEAMPEISDEDVDQALAELNSTQLEDLDLDALSGLGNSAWPETDEEPFQMSMAEFDADSTIHNMNFDAVRDLEDVRDSVAHDERTSADYVIGEDTANSIDYEHYLKQVYQEDSLNTQVDKIFQRVDMHYLDDLLSKLPNPMKELTGKLGADEMKQWLAVNKLGNQSLTELLQYVRRLVVESESQVG
ncbi:MAG: hypothetical protein AMJ53_16875 [Gammaproteobacteria bacterium SG8_11]|nr:MAG: hypothetical protein AMJ53_16875 [Gammaproteobacteria bacterium SG8_11]